MAIHQEAFTIRTRGRGTTEVTHDVARCVRAGQVHTGLCHVFIHHTSASLLLQENADPSVQTDLETFMADLVPDGDRRFRHRAEGPDDMPGHIRSVLTESALSLPVTRGDLGLGTWQGLFVWEHRHAQQTRQLTVTVMGE